MDFPIRGSIPKLLNIIANQTLYSLPHVNLPRFFFKVHCSCCVNPVSQNMPCAAHQSRKKKGSNAGLAQLYNLQSTQINMV